VMNNFPAHDWLTVFSTEASVGATLTGLVFIALSINLKQILELPGLAGRAGEALLLLMLPILVGLAGVLPQTSLRPLGVEFVAIGLIEWALVTRILTSGRKPARERPTHEFLLRCLGAELGVLPTIVAGGILVAEHPAALWWQAAGTAVAIVAGVGDAWILLVEILR